MRQTAVYDEKFYEGQRSGSRHSSRIILGIAKDLFAPRSIVDIGCGSGAWLRSAQEMGIPDLNGVDGAWSRPQHADAQGIAFHYADLSTGDVDLGRRFDLALSVEVAEHLRPEVSDRFVDTLTRLSDRVLFSAAIPHQGGMNHVAERWQSDWAQRFLRRGYRAYDAVRPRIWTNADIPWWYRQNIVVYVKEGAEVPALGAPSDPAALDVVHPEMFKHVMNEVPMRQAYRAVMSPHRYTRVLRGQLRRLWSA
ncbi:MAG TPA: methyltransferase domain-containing protein [Azospirillum sp.]